MLSLIDAVDGNWIEAYDGVDTIVGEQVENAVFLVCVQLDRRKMLECLGVELVVVSHKDRRLST